MFISIDNTDDQLITLINSPTNTCIYPWNLMLWSLFLVHARYTWKKQLKCMQTIKKLLKILLFVKCDICLFLLTFKCIA